MNILSSKLPMCACISCLPEFGKLLAAPTAIGIIVDLAINAPALIKKGEEVKNQVSNIVSSVQQQSAKSKKGGVV